MQRWIGLILLSLVLNTPSVFARTLTTEQKLSDFATLVNTIEAGYGPRDYKAQQRGIVLADLEARYQAEISNTTTNKEFYYTVARFVAEFKDGHFGVNIPTTHVSKLPVSFDLVDGKVLIDSIHESLSKADFPFERGDELVKFDGRAIADELAEVKKYIPSGNEKSITRIAAWSLTFRRGSRMPVATGELGETVIVHAKTGRAETVKPGVLKWAESGKPLEDNAAPEGETRLSGFGLSRINYDMLSVRETYEDFIGGEERMERSFACNGGTRGTIPGDWVDPNDANNVKKTVVLMKSPFTAYYHYDPRFNGYVGYLRIPHYFPQNERGEFAFEERFAQYQYAVAEMEANTVAMVIDQDHNCGGSVAYLEDMLGLFFQGEYALTQFQLLASKASVDDFQSWVDSVPDHTREKFWVETVLELITKTWKETTDFLTVKTSISGRRFKTANEVSYTKPIIVLIDEIAGSGGDAFPGMIAARPKTKLLGTTTSGLGGHVEEFPRLPNSQLGGRYTKSLFYRADGVPVENNGAVPAPGHEYTITYNDFVDGYREYQAFYLQKLLELMQAQPE